jgi:hypothetical protein
MRSALIPVLMTLSVPILAEPAGKPPPMPMSFHQSFVGCQLPLEITLQGAAAVYRTSAQKKFNTGVE